MRSATRLLIVVLSALSLALPLSATATAEEDPIPVVAVEQTTPPATTDATAPSGPELEHETEADQADTRRKLVMGIASVVLLGLVIWGRSVRRKRAKAE
jgi:hypothetical protein